jgi:V8-like Glu-specific endopeptidase
MKIKISTKTNGSSSRTIDETITCELNAKLELNGPGVKNYIVEMDNHGRYFLSFNKLKLSRTSHVYMLDEKGRVLYHFSGRNLNGISPFSELRSFAVDGDKFTIMISSEDSVTTSLMIKSINRVDLPITKDRNNLFDEFGRISYSDLKSYDNEASSFIPPVGKVSPIGSHGTGWLLGKTGYFITNSHVIQPGNHDGHVAATVRFLQRDNDNYSGLSISAEEIIVLGTEDEDDHNNDYALVSLSPFDLENSRVLELVGGLALNTEDETNDIGTTVFMPGYPGYVQESLVSYLKDNDSESRATLVATKEEQLRYDCYSAPGASGSPVISNDKKIVLGIDWGFDNVTPDPDYIFSGVKGSHIWKGISEKISSGDNVNIQGLSLKRNVRSASYIITQDDEWAKIMPFNGSLYFREFSGILQHFDNYSTVKVNAFNENTPQGFELTIRIAQSTSEGIFSLKESKGAENEEKMILAKCLQEDNTININVSNSSWVGMESINSNSDEIVNYVIFQFFMNSLS